MAGVLYPPSGELPVNVLREAVVLLLGDDVAVAVLGVAACRSGLLLQLGVRERPPGHLPPVELEGSVFDGPDGLDVQLTFLRGAPEAATVPLTPGVHGDYTVTPEGGLLSPARCDLQFWVSPLPPAFGIVAAGSWRARPDVAARPVRLYDGPDLRMVASQTQRLWPHVPGEGERSARQQRWRIG